jgi:hypothetical protein
VQAYQVSRIEKSHFVVCMRVLGKASYLGEVELSTLPIQAETIPGVDMIDHHFAQHEFGRVGIEPAAEPGDSTACSMALIVGMLSWQQLGLMGRCSGACRTRCRSNPIWDLIVSNHEAVEVFLMVREGPRLILPGVGY